MTASPTVHLRSRTAASSTFLAEARIAERPRALRIRERTRGTAGTAGTGTRTGTGTADDALVWRSGRLEMRFQRSADRPVMLTRLIAGDVETRFAHPVPLVGIGTAESAGDPLVRTPIGAALRYVSHAVSDDGITLEITSETPEGIRAVVTISGRDGAFRCATAVVNGTGEPVRLTAVTSWASPLGVRLDKGGIADPASDWELLEGREHRPGAARWSARPLPDDGLLPDRGPHPDPVAPVVRTASGTWSPGRVLPVAGLRSDRQEVTWLWEVLHDGPWRWEVGEHEGDCHVVVSGPTDRDHGWSRLLDPGDAFATAPTLVAVGADLEAAAAALTRARRSARLTPPDDDGPDALDDPAAEHAARILPLHAEPALLSAPIAAASAPLTTLPEQTASRAHPEPGMTPERTAFTLVTGLSGRLRISGRLDRLDDAQRELASEAVRTAAGLHPALARSVPLWPLGFPSDGDRWVASARDAGDHVVVSVWDLGDDAGSTTLSFPGLVGRRAGVDLVFPLALPGWDVTWEATRGILRVRSVPGGASARVLRITPDRGLGERAAGV